MNRDDILVCVADDLGIRTWLERALDGLWPVEFVASSDFSRASRLVEATGSRFVMVAVDDQDPGKALRVIAALAQPAGDDLTVVTVARLLNHDFLLKSMRAGARDCFVAGTDGGEVRARIQQFLHDAPAPAAKNRQREGLRKITLVTSASPTVDSRLFAQSLAFALNQQHPGDRILALDTAATERHAFYLDSNNRLTFENLLQNSESLDESLIETALEEYAPNLRLLEGRLSAASASEERNADLFIAISQLLRMFDRLIINVDPSVADFWIHAIGLHACELVMVTHPIVEHAHMARQRLQSWRDHLAKDCRQSLLLDCYEKKGSPVVSEMVQAVGVNYLGALPLDWQNRLMAINAGLPLHKLPRKSAYQRQLEALLRKSDFSARPKEESVARGLEPQPA